MNHRTDLFRSAVTLHRVASVFGKPSRDDLALINALASRELSSDEIFVLSGDASNDAADSYFTHMDPATSLQNFARDLSNGSAFLDSHDETRLPIGASFFGKVEPIPGGRVEGVDASTQVRGRWYMLRDHNVPGRGANTNDYIAGIEAGTVRKLSIGFGGPKMRLICDVDGRDMWDWDAPHYPGEILEDGTTVLYTVYDADLYETSAVYKNATPGALIARWQELITDGRIPSKEVDRLSRVAHHRFAVPAFRSYPTRPRTVEDQFASEGLTLDRFETPKHSDPVGYIFAPTNEPITLVRSGEGRSRPYEFDPYYSNLEDAPDGDEPAGLVIVGGPTGNDGDDPIVGEFRSEGLHLTR